MKSILHLIKIKLHFAFDQNKTPNGEQLYGLYWSGKKDLDNYFTGYLVNTTDSTQRITRQDGSLMMIQEAQNEQGEWQPIEYWVRSGCGNSYFDPLILGKNQYAMFAIRKYSGDYKTKIRLKIKTNGMLFYSPPFDGSIDIAQFEKQKDQVHGILYSGPALYLED